MYTIPFQTTDWNTQPEEIHPGETGQASWRTIPVSYTHLTLPTNREV